MSVLKNFTFHRPQLAKSYCESLEGQGLIDSRSGLFLAAPRRTGKSTFLRVDLLPEMQLRGWTTIYVDLWADKSKDPAILIKSALKAKINTFDSTITKLVKATGLEKVNVFGALSLNLESLALPGDITLPDAIEALAIAGNVPVAIVVDEAQHALSTQAGIDAMFALKAARDHLNQVTGEQRFYLVLTGSNRDKLAHLVLKRTEPFYGANVTKFPFLGRDFTDAYTNYLNPLLASSNQFSQDDMFEAFKIVGHRPEMLRNIVADIALNDGAGELGLQLRSGAEEIKQRAWGEMESELTGLTDIQRVVLEIIIKQGTDYAPFSEKSMQAYADVLQEKVLQPSVQAALDSLREKGLVWRPAYGVYVLEDEALASWYISKTKS